MSQRRGWSLAQQANRERVMKARQRKKANREARQCKPQGQRLLRAYVGGGGATDPYNDATGNIE